MTVAFVLGNGISRKTISLNQLQQLGKTYGCNALYREFEPDVLVSTDRPIAAAIQQSGYAQTHRFYTRRPLTNTGAQQVPSQYFGYSSGPIAASIAAQDGNHRIYLLGFDLGPTQENCFNNIYAGTEFYKNTNASPTFTGNWIKQLCRITKDYPQTTFIRVMGETSACIREFASLSNLESLDLPVFMDRINTTTEL
jgi:hypothetical protein